MQVSACWEGQELMVKALLAVFIVLLCLAAVAAAVGASSAGSPRARPAVPAKPSLSSWEIVVLFVLGAIALGAAGYVIVAHGDVWWLLSIAGWLLCYRLVRSWSNTRPQRRSAAQQEKAQRESDRKKSEVAQRVAGDRSRLEEFGQEGIKLLKVADAAAKRIFSTEAAQAGSLGELDFRAELGTLEETLRRASTIRNVMAESWAIPGRSQDDLELYRDARRTLRRLDSSAREQVERLSRCADEAVALDRMRREDEGKSRIALQRDDVRARLSALLYVADLPPAAPASEIVDRVAARVDAFRELRGPTAIDRQVESCSAEADREKPTST